MVNYHPIEIEEKWLKAWEGRDLYKANKDPWDQNTPGGKTQSGETDHIGSGRIPSSGVEKKVTRKAGVTKLGSKYYALVEFPYPSGDGLHMGHAFTNTILDVLARQKRMAGGNVLHPMGWDAFGLPTENSAIKHGVQPAKLTAQNTARFKKQNKRLGMSYDWSREIDTTDPNYYKWTQWIFIQLFKHGLAYKEETPVGWCPSCKIVLANEEIIGGKCERCGHPVEYRQQAQWLLRITAYADRLADELDLVDYPEYVKKSQREWIGRSEGVEIEFQVKSQDTPGGRSETDRGGRMSSPGVEKPGPIRVFTTAIDTIFGTTFMVLSPEVAKKYLACVPAIKKKEVEQYIEVSLKKSELERQAEGKAKTGVAMGFNAVNPFNNGAFPVFVADYVLASYGTGAVMGVPGHDWRDHEFAEKYRVSITPVIKPRQAFEKASVKEDGFWDYSEIKANPEKSELFNSGKYDGLTSLEAKKKLEDEIEARKIGTRKVNYHLRDWVFSRQHYWGEPIPMVYCPACAKKGMTWWDTEEGKAFLGNPKSEILNSKQVQNSKPSDPKQKSLENLDLENLKLFRNLKLEIRNSKHGLAGWFPVFETDLPVKLPEVEKYEPTETGESPLAKMTDWVRVKCPVCGAPAKRETDTMPNWAGSSWYYLAFCIAEQLKNPKSEIRNPKQSLNSNDQNSKEKNWDKSTPGGSKLRPKVTELSSGSPGVNNIFEENKDILAYWLPVDLYLGGAEHTTLHLLYSRFWHKFLNDIEVVPGKEPYAARRQHGVILGEDGARMSKSRGNVINPEEAINKFGADALRVYLMFMGPYEATMPWSTKGLEGAYRFLSRIWRLAEQEINHTRSGRMPSPGVEKKDEISGVGKTNNKQLQPEADRSLDETASTSDLVRALHKTVKKVTEDIAELKHNTAIAALMEFVNVWSAAQQGEDTPGAKRGGRMPSPGVGKGSLLMEEVGIFIRLLAPFAPFLAEEWWQRLAQVAQVEQVEQVERGDKVGGVLSSVHLQPWPEYDPELVKEDQVTVVIQVNGKRRGQIELASDEASEQSSVEEMAKKEPNIVWHLEGKSVKKVIFVPERLINFVV